MLTVWLCSRYEQTNRLKPHVVETKAFAMEHEAMQFYDNNKRGFCWPWTFWAYPQAVTFTEKVQMWRNGLMAGRIERHEAEKLLVEGKVTVVNDQAVDWIMSTKGNDKNGEG